METLLEDDEWIPGLNELTGLSELDAIKGNTNIRAKMHSKL